MYSRATRAAIATLLLLLAASNGHASDAVDHKPIEQSDVLAYLDQLMEWQRNAMAIEPAMNTARERIFEDSLQQNATHVLESGFSFARVEAGLLSPDTNDSDSDPGDTPSPRQLLQQRAKETDNQIAGLTAQRANLHPQSGHSLAQQRQDIDDQLKLANARKELLATVLANVNAANSDNPKGFLNKINNLAHSIPELNADSSKMAAKTIGVSPSTNAAETTDGTSSNHPSTSVFGLASVMFDITRKQSELKTFMAQTTQLETATRALMKPLRESLDNPSQTAKVAGGNAPAAPTKPLTIDQRVAAYKQVGAAIVPLGEANLWVSVARRTIKGWQQVLDAQLHTLTRQLVIRLLILAATLAVPLIISEVAHRAITRYFNDLKRRQQLNAARRIITGLAIFLILLGTFISDFSSFATFAGFITAGLAVALQSVLLALVAHFFFYGRYGVRAGDRVNVAGVTGDIVQIGMVRFYLRELRDTEQGFQPTGKMVAFPNSILFQPSAFYKYV